MTVRVKSHHQHDGDGAGQAWIADELVQRRDLTAKIPISTIVGKTALHVKRGAGVCKTEVAD